jgi:hypothetical protein
MSGKQERGLLSINLVEPQLNPNYTLLLGKAKGTIHFLHVFNYELRNIPIQEYPMKPGSYLLILFLQTLVLTACGGTALLKDFRLVCP